MNKTALMTLVFPVILLGCTTVQMPELSSSHPANAGADDANAAAWPSILHVPEEPVVAPPLPIVSAEKDVADAAEDHPDHAMAGMDMGRIVYVCPMDPDEVSDAPGFCAKCGMALVKKGGA